MRKVWFHLAVSFLVLGYIDIGTMKGGEAAISLGCKFKGFGADFESKTGREFRLDLT